MGFLKLIWGHEKHTPDAEPISPDEIRRTFKEYDRKLDELNEAMHALRDHEPDRRERPHAP